ncbi:MAG: hypothetical protein ABI565_14815 [Vicinamibacteria bacterium]
MLTLLLLSSFQLAPPVRPFAPSFLVPPAVAGAGIHAGRANAPGVSAAKPVCSIQIIEADPKLDPKIVRPTAEGFDAKIVRPADCRK